MCDCFTSMWIEIQLFSKDQNKANIPKEDCPICFEPLDSPANNSCCAGYGSRLNCGHYVHVSCQIHKNSDLRRCSICRKELAHHFIYHGIISKTIVSKLSPSCFEALKKKLPLSSSDNDELKKRGIEFESLRKNLELMYENQDNAEVLEKVFQKLWIKK